MLQPNDAAAILAKLTEPSAKPRWVVIGEVLEELERLSPADTAGVPWLRRAVAELSRDPKRRMGPNQLRKIARVHEFVRRLIERGELAIDWSKPPVGAAGALSTLEVCQRLYAIDREQGLEKIRQALNGDLAYHEIVADYRKVRAGAREHLDSHRATLVRGEDLAQAFERALDENPNQFLGLHNHHGEAWRPSRPLGRFAVAVDRVIEGVDRRGQPFVDGVECIALDSDSERRQWPRHRMRIGFYAGFFRRLWVVVGGERDMALNVYKDLSLLLVRNAGIVFATDDRIELLSAPIGVPEPDRRHLLMLKPD
jgi:hypothetical protein